MRLVVYLLLLASGQSILALGGQGLVNPQSACNIRCENGGMCAFSFDNPQFHTCICLMGVYEGERCEYEVGRPRTAQQEQLPPQGQQPPRQQQSAHSQPSADDVNKMRQLEMERLREEQRRREQELKVEAERRKMAEQERQEAERRRQTEHQRRVGVRPMPMPEQNTLEQRQEVERQEAERRRQAEHQRRVGVRPMPEQNIEQQQKIEELRRRDEELRRAAARRREEEKRREEEQRRREGDEDERRAEEERRKEFGRREEERIREEQWKAEERQKMDRADKERFMEEEMNKEEDTAMEQDDAVTEANVVLGEEDYRDYKSDEEEEQDDYLHAADKELEKVDISKQADIELGVPRNEPLAADDAAVVSETEKPEHDHQLGEIAKVIEAAAEETLKHHDIEDERESLPSNNDHDNDDYWDHSIKREDEEYEVPQVMDSEEERELTPTKTVEAVDVPPTTTVREFAAEEGEEGWMMMKRVDENSSAFTLSATLTALFVIMIRLY